MRTLRRILFVGLGAFILLGSTGANATIITFDEAGPALVHGSIVDTQYTGIPWGATISAVNLGSGPNLAVAFDSTANPTRDSDLEDPWSGGNLAPNPTPLLGNVLIIQENNVGTDDGVADRPDDELAQPAGVITIAFNQTYDTFGLDLLDIENNTEAANYRMEFYNGAVLVDTVVFSDLTDAGDAAGYYQTGGSGIITWGDNSANRVDAITLSDFNSVEIYFGGSGAIDNIEFSDGPGTNTNEVPEPATMALLGLGLAGFAARSRKRRSA
jgi:hypothetical protein